MKVATTLQVRNAIQQAANALDIVLHTSWTNKRINPNANRSVCFSLYNSDTSGLAKRVEKQLAKQGLSSTVTVTGGVAFPYLRATCNIA